MRHDLLLEGRIVVEGRTVIFLVWTVAGGRGRVQGSPRDGHYIMCTDVCKRCCRPRLHSLAQVLAGQAVAPRGKARRAPNQEFFQFGSEFVSASVATSWGFPPLPGVRRPKKGDGKGFQEKRQRAGHPRLGYCAACKLCYNAAITVTPTTDRLHSY
jgi:hypothetical protein